MSITIRQILQTKGADVWSVSPDTSVYEALQIMADRDVGALFVVKEGRLVGIFSERDYARKVALNGKSSKDATVREMMTQQVLFMTPNESVDDCMALMTAKRVRHLPVLENDQLTGIVTIGDVVKSVIAEQKLTIDQLEKYVSGNYGMT